MENLDKKQKAGKGEFWMAWETFVDEFENLTVCHLPKNFEPENSSEKEMRIKGTFSYDGEVGPKSANDLCSSFLNSKKTIQVNFNL